MSNVKSIFGGPTYEKKPNQACVEVLEEWLEMARSGEIVGVAMAALEHDGCGRYALCGSVGGYSMVGALRTAEHSLLTAMRDD